MLSFKSKVGPCFIVLAILFSPSSKIYAGTYMGLKAETNCSKVFAFKDKSLGFIYPNETHPQQIKSEYEKAPPGAIFALGTDRGFIGASLASGTKALFLVDKETPNLTYNAFNRALLSLSKDRVNYLFLRFHANHRQALQQIQIMSKKRQLGHLSVEDLETLRNPALWDWWITNVRNNGDWKLFHAPPGANENQAFENANYLYDDVLYSRVSSIAKTNQIIIIKANLKEPEGLTLVSRKVKDQNVPLSILDLSNGWEEGYIGHEKTMNLVRHLAPLMAPEAKFVITFLAPREAPYFQYVVSDFQMMLDESFMALFLRNYAIRIQFTFSMPTRRSSGYRFFGEE